MATQNFRVKNGLEVGIGVTISAGIITATTVSIGGSITAGSFYGDGSGLTNAGSSLSAASGSQRVVLTSLTSGTMTSAATNSDLLYDSSTGTLSCTNISIGGTLTYEDVTNVDSIGIITARNGVRITDGGLDVVGVSTFTNSINLNSSNLTIATGGIIKLGNSDELEIYYNGSIGQTIKSTSDLRILTTRLLLNNAANTEQLIEATQNGSVALFHDNSKKFETTGAGATVFGTLETQQLNVSGVSTASTVNDTNGNVRIVPQNLQTSSYILVESDRGKHISITTGGVTVPASVFSVGDAVTIYNNSGSNQTITQGVSATLRQAGTSNTGNRTLGQYGLATLLCVSSNTFVISGAGLS